MSGFLGVIKIPIIGVTSVARWCPSSASFSIFAFLAFAFVSYLALVFAFAFMMLSVVALVVHEISRSLTRSDPKMAFSVHSAVWSSRPSVGIRPSRGCRLSLGVSKENILMILFSICVENRGFPLGA